MGIYYHAPQPTQAAARGPIGAQGDQPPRSSIVRMQVAVGSWPRGYEPAQYRSNFSRVSIAPLTLVYGDQPPRRSERRPDYAWYTPNARVQMPVWSTVWDAPVVVSQVPPSLWQQQIWRAWNFEQARVQSLANLAPLTLVYGDQPPLLAKSWQGQYETPYWSVRPTTAAWNVPAPVTGDDPPPKVLPWYTFSNWFEITWSSQHANAVTSLLTIEPVASALPVTGGGSYRPYRYLSLPETYKLRPEYDEEELKRLILEAEDRNREEVELLERKSEELYRKGVALAEIKTSILAMQNELESRVQTQILFDINLKLRLLEIARKKKMALLLLLSAA